MKMMKKVILAESPVNIWVVKYETDDKLNADILMGIWIGDLISASSA